VCNAFAWNNLGYVDGGRINGKAYNEKECHQQALELKADYPEAWNNLGVQGGGSVSGKAYNEKECFQQALELKDDYPDTWYNLGAAGGGTVAGRCYSQDECNEKYTECLEKDEVEYSDTLGRPFSLREIVVNFANVGASYGVKVLGREGTGLFDWDGVRKACRFLKHERGWKVTGVINENYTGRDQAQGGNNSIRLPQDIKQLCDGDVLETPRITTSNHSSADDEMTIKCAYRRNSRFLDNDNYRDWLTQLHDDKIREWLNTYQDLLHTRYFFDKATGDFDLIEGNVPSHMLAQGIKNVDKKALWTMNR